MRVAYGAVGAALLGRGHEQALVEREAEPLQRVVQRGRALACGRVDVHTRLRQADGL